MNNDENNKGLVSPKRLNESEQKEISGGERVYLHDIPGFSADLADWEKEMTGKLVSQLPGVADSFKKIKWDNNSYLELDDDGNEALDKLVVEVSTKMDVKDLSPGDRKILKDWGLL